MLDDDEDFPDDVAETEPLERGDAAMPGWWNEGAAIDRIDNDDEEVFPE